MYWKHFEDALLSCLGFFLTRLKFNFFNILAEKLVFMLVKMYFCVLATEQLCSVASTQKIQISNVVLASKLIKGTEYRKLESNLMNVIDLANWISQRNLSQKRIRTGWRKKKKNKITGG